MKNILTILLLLVFKLSIGQTPILIRPFTGSPGFPIADVIALNDSLEALRAYTNAVAGSLTDGNKGDVTVSNTGATWTINAGVIDNPKISDLNWAKLTSVPTNVSDIGALTATTGNFILSVAGHFASQNATQAKIVLAIDQVENTALTTWTGATTIIRVGTLTTGATGAGFTLNFGSSTLSGNITGSNILESSLAGLATSNFSSAAVSQWTNDAGYITASSSTTLTNKTISGSSNTLSAIGISSLSTTGSASSATFLRGDGVWSSVSGTLSDGSKGDITVSASGATWLINSGAVQLATDVSGNLPVTNLNAGTGASATTYWTGNGTWSTPVATVSNADYGDITVSGSTWTIDNGVVTNAKLAGSIAASKLIATDITTVGTISSGVWNGTIVTGAFGGTSNGFFAVTGPATSLKTFTFPNASSTVLTDNAVVTGAQGGTGVANSGKTITLANNFVTVGNFSLTLTQTASTNVTLPTTGTLSTLAGTETFTNKTLTAPVIATITNNGTLTLPNVTGTIVQYVENSINTTSTPGPTGGARENFYVITALASNANFQTPTGTPVNNNMLLVRVKDNGTQRNLSFGSSYAAGAQLPLPSTTTVGSYLYLQFSYNSQTSTWDLIGSTLR